MSVQRRSARICAGKSLSSDIRALAKYDGALDHVR